MTGLSNGRRELRDVCKLIPMEDAEQRGPAQRMAVLKTAKLVFNGAVFDCVVVNASTAGVRVRLHAPVALPEHLVIQIAGGAAMPAERRWARGLEAGLHFAGPATLSAVRRGDALRIYEELRSNGIVGPLDELRRLRCFDDPALSSLADAADAAVRDLETALRRLSQNES